MNLKKWLNEKRGRCTALAAELGVTIGRVSQMADDGVPTKYMLTVRTFTKNVVSLESMVQDRTTPPAPDGVIKSTSPTLINLEITDQERREIEDRREAARQAEEIATAAAKAVANV